MVLVRRAPREGWDPLTRSVAEWLGQPKREQHLHRQRAMVYTMLYEVKMSPGCN